MREYFHIYPTCPACYSPHTLSSEIVVNKNHTAVCKHCGAGFRTHVKFTRDKYPETAALLEKFSVGNRLPEIPLVWGIRPNPVEGSYLEWIRKSPSGGVYYITWPWPEVKFLPIMVNEFLESDVTSGNVCVITSGAAVLNRKEVKQDIYLKPDFIESARHMIYLDGDMCELKNPYKISSVKREINRFDVRREVGIKRKIVHFKVRILGRGEIREGICSDDSITKCKNRFKRNIPKRDIRNIEIVKINGKRYYDRNVGSEDGVFEITLIEKEEYPEKLGYTVGWLWNILINSTCVKRPFKKWVSLNDNLKYSESGDHRVYVMPVSDVKKITECIERVDDLKLITVPDFDYIVAASRSSRISICDLIDIFFHISEIEDIPVLLFSTSPALRSEYWRDLRKMEKLKIHTWDNINVISELSERWYESKYPNPLSSILEESGVYRVMSGELDAEFITCGEVPDPSNVLSAYKNLSDSLREIIEYFLKFAMRSPLSPLGGDPEFLFTLKGYDHMNIEEFIRERNENVKVFRDFLLHLRSPENISDGVPVSRIGYRIATYASEIIEKGEDVVFVVYPWDVSRWKKLVNSVLEGDRKRIKVSSWKWIFTTHRTYPSSTIIATYLPWDVIDVYSKPVKRIVFAGYEGNIRIFKKIWSNKIIGHDMYPIYFDEYESPAELKKILNSLRSQKFDSDIIFEIKMRDMYNILHKNYTQDNALRTIKNYLNPGERAYMLRFSDDTVILLPSNRGVLVITPEGVEEIRLSKNKPLGELSKKIVGNRILLDARGVYISFKKIFVQMMFEYGGSISFRFPPYIWEGFEELYSKSIFWIIFLRGAIEYMHMEENIPWDVASKRLAEILSRSGIYAKDRNYIERWWIPDDFILYRDKEIPVFNTEHPERIRDMDEIYAAVLRDVFENRRDRISEILGNREDLVESFYASRFIQKMRNKVFKKDLASFDFNVQDVLRLLKTKIMELSETGSSELVTDMRIVKILKRVEPFTRIPFDTHTFTLIW